MVVEGKGHHLKIGCVCYRPLGLRLWADHTHVHEAGGSLSEVQHLALGVSPVFPLARYRKVQPASGLPEDAGE